MQIKMEINKINQILYSEISTDGISEINNLVNKIDNMLAPVFGKITDMLGGGLKIIGSVMGVINKILGFEGFLCGNPKCPEVENFKNSLWGGPDPKHLQDFKNFSFIKPQFVGEVEETVDNQVTNFLGRIGIGGSDAVNPAESPGECMLEVLSVVFLKLFYLVVEERVLLLMLLLMK